MKLHKKKSAPTSEELNKKIQERIGRDTVERILYFTVFLSGLFFVFGFTSLSFIQNFDPTITLFGNVWPRLLLNTFPLLGLAYYMKNSTQKSSTKIYVWLIVTCLIFNIAAMIHVWPIAWNKNVSIILYVNATNNTLFATIGMLLSLAMAPALRALATIATLVWLPLAIVLFHRGDSVEARTILADTIFIGCSVFALGYGASKARYKLALLEVEKELEATRFLGPMVSQAIFNNRNDILENQKVTGFVAQIDIRDSTEHQKEFGQNWLNFRKEYFSLVAKSVARHGGYIQKTVGDCHVLNFGVMERHVDLSDIPGIEEDEKRAEERRLGLASERAFACLDEIFNSFENLAHRSFPGQSIHLGAGIDKGFVERSVQGDSSTVLELDVNGDPVNCSSRLQEYSKILRKEMGLDASLLVVSPFASDYLTDTSAYRKKETRDEPVRNYPNIHWILYRTYSSISAIHVENKAA